MRNLCLRKTNFLHAVSHISRIGASVSRSPIVIGGTKRHKEDFTVTHLEADYFYFQLLNFIGSQRIGQYLIRIVESANIGETRENSCKGSKDKSRSEFNQTSYLVKRQHRPIYVLKSKLNRNFNIPLRKSNSDVLTQTKNLQISQSFLFHFPSRVTHMILHLIRYKTQDQRTCHVFYHPSIFLLVQFVQMLLLVLRHSKLCKENFVLPCSVNIYHEENYFFRQ